MLAKHWPDVPIEEDVKELASDPRGLVPDCDILTAGYPCQPFSQAGVRRGEEDDRHIWPEIFTIVQAKRPRWCVFENVSGHTNMGLDQVLSDLESVGYTVQPFVVPACAVDAPHRRDRVWIIAAHADSNGEPAGTINAESGCWQLGASNVGHADSGYCTRIVSRESKQRKSREGFTARCKGVADVGKMAGWLPEPPVGRVANGIPQRMDRLKGLGNAIVPQIAMQIGLTIKAVEINYEDS